MAGERTVTEYQIVGEHSLLGQRVMATLGSVGPDMAGVHLRREIHGRSADWTGVRVQSREVGPWVDVPVGGEQA